MSLHFMTSWENFFVFRRNLSELSEIRTFEMEMEHDEEHPKGTVQEGDLVILYGGRDNVNTTCITSGETFYNVRGTFPHKKLIGLPYGTKVYIYILYIEIFFS